jgi:hypothetical protein
MVHVTENSHSAAVLTATAVRIYGVISASARQPSPPPRAALNRESHVANLLQWQPVSVNELALDALR